ncbi:MAG: FkbM family methyltransferase [Opitutae bacterium]|nr:FkbM family methyltransferase [Opitutae bacterium]
MSLIWKLLRAENYWQPGQLPRRAWRKLSGVSRRRHATVFLPWGHPLEINPQESIGRSITALNSFDLPVAETIWRLLDDGETAADIGANIGYMSSAMAARLCRGGRVLSFEPMPELAARLRMNAHSWRALTTATIEIHELAVSNDSGTATLYSPPDFANNNGLASLQHPTASASPGTEITVQCMRLDDTFPEPGRLALIKVDVEGNEFNVFSGASQLLDTRRVRDIIFEEKNPFPTPSISFLESKGYAVFRVARGLLGPVLLPPQAKNSKEIDSPTFLGTMDPQRACERFAPRGWFSLTGKEI